MYIEVNGVPVLEPDSAKWGEWFFINDRIVKKSTIGCVEISTVFLGMDHSFREEKILVYETMFFVEEGKDQYDLDGYLYDRYSNRKEASQGHKDACDFVLDRYTDDMRQLKLFDIHHND